MEVAGHAANLYNRVLDGARALDPEERVRLIRELQDTIDDERRFVGSRSPLEFLGLGKEVWRDPETGELIDAQEYVDRERESWVR